LEITGGNPDYFVTYFETLADAQGVVNPIITPTAYDNTVQGFQIIYARVVDVLFPDCSSIVSLELQVNDAPAITDPITDYFVCDLDGNGIETFDLTSKDAEILNSLVDVSLTYHESFADADAGLFPITPATAYISPSATIWVRAVNYEDGDISNDPLCVTVGQFDLILGETPSFNVILEIEACDDDIADGITEFDLNSYNEIITGGNPGLTVTYHSTFEFAEDGFPALPVFYTNSTNPEDIWVRVSDVSGCYGIFMSSLVVVARPEIFEPLPLIYCDDDNDGFGTFILTDADEQVVGGNPAGNLQVSYHATLADAINGVLSLVSPYDNEVPFDQIIYVRLLDIATGCYNTTILHLLVEERPSITDPQPLVVCDTDGDGIAVFNLTAAEPDILQGLTGGPYVVSYFTDIAMTSAIVNPLGFSNTVNPQTIYVTVSDTNNDCESETTLTLQVEIPPLLINPTPLELCDQTDIIGPDDALEIFDLTSKIAEITGGDLGVSISFFESFSDMQSNTDAILNPTAYQNIIAGVVQNPQTIWLRAADVNSSCVVDTGSVTLDLIVNPLPSPIAPDPLEVCDVDNDGFGEFILTDKDIEIIGGEPGVVISYHETLSDAENAIFPINSPYQNIVSGLQVVYVRATYDDVPPATGTGCWRVLELELLVNPTPIVPLDIAPIIVCDADMDGFASFDLTQRAAIIYGTQDVTQYALSYYLSELAAADGTPAIASPSTFINTVTPLQTIWIRLEHIDSECFKVGSFDIEVVDGPTVVQPDAFNMCDDLGAPFDGITTFDLTTQDVIITAGEPSVGVQYYETLSNAEADIDAINPATAYVNTVNLQTIYVRVTDGNSLCIDTSITLTLRVLPNPQPEQPDPIALCDTDGDGQEEFDLTIRAAQILDGASYDLLYYETEELAIAGAATTEIADPTAYTNTSNPQIIYIRVTNPGSDAFCFEIVALTISVNGLPDDGALLEDYIVCELPFDGISIFDLTTKTQEILVGQDMVNNVVSFYVTPADATAGINPIPIPTAYQNITNPQAIYVGITNTATSCYIGGVQFFNIEVKQGAMATSPSGPYVLCDQEGENDGFTSFDLTLQSLLDEILNGQDPSAYLLTFHETLANAMDAENPLGASYTNIINPQIIYARVENAATACYEVVEVILKVNQLPVVTLEESYRLCVDENGQAIPSSEGASSPPVIDTGLDSSLYTFLWTLDAVEQIGETGSSITALSGGVYEVNITQLSSGCQTVVSTTVTVSQAPVEWSFNLTNGAFADSHTVEVLAQGLGVYVYSIDGGPFQDSNLFDNVSPGTHTITVKDANGCGEISFDIGVVDYPNYFTPNGDGYHDTWNIIGIADFDATANIYIFDRFGKLLKQISPLSSGWDGTYNGDLLPSSDYWFRVEYTEQAIQKELKGHFSLKR
jgi:gliding motility-associated-like protein